MNKTLSKSFLWMFIGLMVTFITGYVISISGSLVNLIYSAPITIIAVILELALVIFFAARIRKMNGTTAKICFLIYSFVSGLTFSSVFIYFKISSVVFVFLVAAIAFAVFGAIGYFTNIDLGRISTILFMGLFAVILCYFINIFVKSDTFDLVVTIISLLIFFGYTAYDVQKIKQLEYEGIDNDAVAVYGAFELYLDFINIFLDLLRIIGDAKD